MTTFVGHASRAEAGPDLSFGFDAELPGSGLPTNEELNAQLFGPDGDSPEPTSCATAPVRAWMTGIVYMEGPFANWARSPLTTRYSVDPPSDYMGVAYRQCAPGASPESVPAPETPTYRRPLARVLGWLAARVDNM
jgi:hypothetical protein